METAVPRPPGHALDCLPKSRRSGLTVSVWRLPLLLPLLNRSGNRKGSVAVAGCAYAAYAVSGIPPVCLVPACWATARH